MSSGHYCDGCGNAYYNCICNKHKQKESNVLNYFVDLEAHKLHVAPIFITPNRDAWAFRYNDVFFEILGIPVIDTWGDIKELLPLINLLEISETPFTMYDFRKFVDKDEFIKVDICWLKQKLKVVYKL